MRYNHIPDSCYDEISRELDQYSSPLFMCYTHLLIAHDSVLCIHSRRIDSWKDTGITGILVFITCRKLKTNILRVYDPSVMAFPYI